MKTSATKIIDYFKVIIDRGLELITVRHYTAEVLESLKRGKIVLQEKRTKNTVQFVVKHVPVIRRKSNVPSDLR